LISCERWPAGAQSQAAVQAAIDKHQRRKA